MARAAAWGTTPASAKTSDAVASTSNHMRYLFSSLQIRPMAARVYRAINQNPPGQLTILPLLHPMDREGQGMQEEPELITIERYRDPLEADLARTRLDSAGITCFLVGENAAVLYGNGLGGLQLQVSAQDEVDARTILNDPGP